MSRESYIASYIEDNICFSDEIPNTIIASSYATASTSSSYTCVTKDIMAIMAIFNGVGSSRKLQIKDISAYSLFGGQANMTIAPPTPTKTTQKMITAASGGTTLIPFPLDSAASIQSGLEVRLYPDSVTLSSSELRNIIQMATSIPQLGVYILDPTGAQTSPGNAAYSNVVAHQAKQNLCYSPQFYAGASYTGTQGLVLNQNEGFALYSPVSINSRISVSVTITNNGNTFIVDQLVPNILIPDHGCFFSILNTHATNKFTINQVSIFESITKFFTPNIIIIPIESYSGGSILTPASMDSANSLPSGVKVVSDCYVDVLGTQYGSTWSPNSITRIALPYQEGNSVGATLIGLSYMQDLYNGPEIEIPEGQGIALINTGSPVQGRYEYSIKFTTTTTASAETEVSYVS